MSTVKCDTLSKGDGSISVPVATIVQGSAKAWVNFNGTGVVAIRASFNVSSITDSGVGVYGVNLINNMPDINYSANVSVSYNPSFGVQVGRADFNNGNPKTVNYQQVASVNNTFANTDCDSISVAIFR